MNDYTKSGEINSDMARAQLMKIANYGKAMFNSLNPDDQLPDWVKSKITAASEHMGAVKHWMDYEMKGDMPLAKRGKQIRPGKVGKVMREFKEGRLYSSSGDKVTDRKQAIAIAMSEAGMSRKMAKGGPTGNFDVEIDDYSRDYGCLSWFTGTVLCDITNGYRLTVPQLKAKSDRFIGRLQTEFYRKMYYEKMDSPKSWQSTKSQMLEYAEKHRGDKIRLRFEDGGLIAPNGKPSNLTLEQYKLVRTPEFKAWFGDWENDPENASKVVDENGEPLVCYHGTRRLFTEFKYRHKPKNLLLHWFMAQNDAKEKVKYYGSWVIYPCFISIKHPLEELEGTPESSIERDIKNGKKTDGLILGNTKDAESSVIIAVPNSNQIKLSSHPIIKEGMKKPNFYEKYGRIFLDDSIKYTFDSNNPDIRYKGGGEVLSNKEIIKDLEFEDQTDTKHGMYSFSFHTEDSEGANILDYDGNIVIAPAESRAPDEFEWGQNVPEDWENAEQYIFDKFYEWLWSKDKKMADGGGIENKWMIRDSNGKYASRKLNGNLVWYEGQDMSYLYSKEDAEILKNYLEEKQGYSGLEVVEYKKSTSYY